MESRSRFWTFGAAAGLLLMLLVLAGMLVQDRDQQPGSPPKQRNGRLARLLLKYRDSMLCMAHIIDSSMMTDEDNSMACCRYDSFNMWLMDKQTEFCPVLQPEQELAHILETLTPSVRDECARVNTDTFSCQMMLLMMNGPR